MVNAKTAVRKRTCQQRLAGKLMPYTLLERGMGAGGLAFQRLVFYGIGAAYLAVVPAYLSSK